jgi:hypothetical protein
MTMAILVSTALHTILLTICTQNGFLLFSVFSVFSVSATH